MIRETIILFSIFMLLQPSDAIKCFDCNSLVSFSCADQFSNTSIRSIDCSQQQLYDLTPVEYCRKIKYKDNDRWVYLRGCHTKDNVQLRDAKVFLCNTNYCNSGDQHRPTIILILLFTSISFIKLLRF